VDAAEIDPLIGRFVGEYKVERQIGQGGMATVYAAVHPLIGKRAAIKVMSASLCVDPTAVVRFIQEARAVNQIGHPNIVDVFSFGRLPDGRSYFVMEWLRGESLFDRMSARRLSLEESLEVIDQIADALDAAHEKGIIHRDLKPANVFLVPVRGRPELVKLLDFGVAKLQEKDGDGGHTRTGFVVGTPDYLSPEQARARAVDHRTDIYALGVVAFEMVLGGMPFTADNPMDLVLQHLSTPPPDPVALWPDIPPALAQLIRAMMAKDPDARPSLPEVRAAVAGLRMRSLPRFVEAPPPRRQRLDAHSAQVGVGIVAVLCGTCLLFGIEWQRMRPAAALVPHAHAEARPAGAPRVVAERGQPVREAPPPLPPVAGHAHTSHAKKPHPRAQARRDGDYLVDPFGPLATP
jgi:serine/threonine-protein kinase